MELKLVDGKELIGLARKSLNYFFASNAVMKDVAPKKFSEKQGVFVTLNEFPSKELRGCIGFPNPIMPLWNAVIEASVSAGFNDPRFNALKLEELEKITLEISVLSVPKEIEGDKELIPEKIEITKDGLIIKMRERTGLLLPQVAMEWEWDSKEFLEQTCVKAGLQKDAWKEKECKILKFQAQIFSEKEPNKKVIEVH